MTYIDELNTDLNNQIEEEKQKTSKLVEELNLQKSLISKLDQKCKELEEQVGVHLQSCFLIPKLITIAENKK
jgi:hypothetical protein